VTPGSGLPRVARLLSQLETGRPAATVIPLRTYLQEPARVIQKILCLYAYKLLFLGAAVLRTESLYSPGHTVTPTVLWGTMTETHIFR
jgi:hypothetical protein